ncbi:hypothetical protein F4810DRAFT_717027 [Camillea tinctor]|nr:hypothetical protein F4810DRAFT_717027 [Camillea tinctor]
MSLTQNLELSSVAGLSLESPVGDGPSVKAKHKKDKPSIDVALAQKLVRYEKLPIVERGEDPEAQVVADNVNDRINDWVTAAAAAARSARPKTGAKVSTLEAWKESRRWNAPWADAEKPQRDKLTGRILAENGKTCLRCTRVGLRCTLNFFGMDREERCAACRRSGAEHCVRPRGFADDELPYRGGGGGGLPSHDLPYVTGARPPLSRAQMEEVLREQLAEDESLLQGFYVSASERARMALPRATARDKEPPEEDEGWGEPATHWRKVLPTHMNRSLVPRDKPPRTATPVDAETESEADTAELQHTSQPPSTGRSSDSDGSSMSAYNALFGNKRKKPTQRSRELDDEQLIYLRACRRYPPRAEHVTEAFPEVW